MLTTDSSGAEPHVVVHVKRAPPTQDVGALADEARCGCSSRHG